VLPIRNAAHVSWTRRHRTLRANHGRRRGKVASLRDAAGAALSSSAASPRFPFYNEDDRVFDWPSLEEGLDVKDAGFEGPAAAERARQTLERIARFAGARSTDGIGESTLPRPVPTRKLRLFSLSSKADEDAKRKKTQKTKRVYIPL
jgi:hypothetical protein